MGYDPVAYFTEGRPMKGSKEFAYDWLGTPWYFATPEHRDLFISDPAEVRPSVWRLLRRRGGLRRATVNIDPEAWRIINGKLYLSYDKGFATEFEAHSGRVSHQGRGQLAGGQGAAGAGAVQLR